MVAIPQKSVCPRPLGPWQFGLVSAAWWLALFVAPVRAQPIDEGIFISVPKPITTTVKEQIIAKTVRALERNIKTIVYDFNPAKHATGVDDYDGCRGLAAYVSRVQANTVAFVHGEVTGHRVLPVVACKELVMSSAARLGDVLHGQREPLEPDQRVFYKTMAERWGPSQAAIILKMLDKDMEVIKAKTLQGADYYLDKAAPPPPEVRLTGREPVVLSKDKVGIYTVQQAQEFQLCKLVKEAREEVKEAYNLLPAALREDPLEGRDPKAMRFVVNQPIDGSLRETLERCIPQAVGQHYNMIILQIDCGGGVTQVAQDLASFLRGLTDVDEQGQFPVQSIAYIPKKAPDAATILALGCTDIVMGKDAEIGDFERIYKPQGSEVDAEGYRMVRESLVGLAQQQGYSPLLARGMLDRRLWIYEVRSQKGQSAWKLVTQEELRADQEGPKQWGTPALIKPGGEEGSYLKLDAELAKRVGLARYVVADFEQLKAIYGLDHVADAKFDFLYRLAHFLQQPAVSMFLIMIGIACLILELKMPGVGLPGVIAAVCFVLYFWAASRQLSGQIIMLAILLFVLGLLLLALEIFVLPGFGVPGISGVVLIVISLALATLEKKPETAQEWLSFGRALGAIALALAVAVSLAFLVARYLPSIPYANRLVLKPPILEGEILDGDDLAQIGVEGVTSEMAALLGAIGVATTTLRPAGIARFGENFVDVVTEGDYVEAGTRVQVVEIEGNRVVVKEL
jgi:membrane-bound ClpP family serine protease